jgi:predicted dehydrogenase
LSSLEIDVDDTALVTLGFVGQAGMAQLVGQLSLDFLRRDRTRNVTAVCEKGTLRWDGIRGVLERRDGAQTNWETVVIDSESEPTYLGQWGSFVNNLETGSYPMVGVKDGIEVLRAIEAIRLSDSLSGRRVHLSEFGDSL